MSMPDKNRMLLVLRDLEANGLALTIEGDKLRPSREVADWERELIVQNRNLIMSVLPTMVFRTKAECRASLRSWYEGSKAKFNKGRRLSENYGH